MTLTPEDLQAIRGMVHEELQGVLNAIFPPLPPKPIKEEKSEESPMLRPDSVASPGSPEVS